MENLNLEHKDNISKFLHRDLRFLINSYVTMLISLLIPAHEQLSNVEHTDLILLILLIWGKIPYWPPSMQKLFLINFTHLQIIGIYLVP